MPSFPVYFYRKVTPPSGTVASGVGTCTGTATAPGKGASLDRAVGSAAGIATAPGKSASLNSAVGSAAGIATAPGVGIAPPPVVVPNQTNFYPFSSAGGGGWIEEGKPRRKITIKQLREILEAQGSPWAKELADVVEELEPKSKKHEALVEEVRAAIAERIKAPIDWTPIITGLRAASQATRTTLAIKHLDNSVTALLAAYDLEKDDEEALLLLI